MKIVFLDRSTIGDDVEYERFNTLGDVVFYDTTTKEQTMQRVKDADVVVTNKVVIDKAIMQESSLKLICVAATGMNNIDLEYAKEINLEVKNVAGYSTASVVQLTFALCLSLINSIKVYDEFTKSDGWVDSPIFTKFNPAFFDISGKKWGIIGLGNIGKGVAIVASAFGADVSYYSTSGKNSDSEYKRVELNKLLQESDIISIHAPLNSDTKDLINKTNLLFLKDDAIILNLGRGGIINEKDLSLHIDNSNIKVGLDVLEVEPMRENCPFRLVKKSENLIITPHLAWASVESRRKLVDGIYQNIKEIK
ncbi:MAG TPA: D-2-hydroxyacid dehydrogenase [Sulfurimonas sp.]|nr:D-2-hydroxyacid dehydrogenase [Sulfurimonas sp.]